MTANAAKRKLSLEFYNKMELRYIFLLPAKIELLTSRLAIMYGVKFPHFYIVDNKNLYPHITLFTTSQRLNNFVKFRSKLSKFLRDFKPIKVKLGDFDVYKDGTFIIEIIESPELLNFRKKILNFVEHNLDEVLFRNKRYKPHITLFRYRSFRHSKVLLSSIRERVSGSFKLESLSVAHCNSFGQFPKSERLFKFRLGNF